MTKRQYNVGYFDDDDALHACYKTTCDLTTAVKRADRKRSVTHHPTDENGELDMDGIDSRHYVFVIYRDLPERPWAPKGDLPAWKPCLEPANDWFLQHAVEMSDSMIFNKPPVPPGWYFKLFPPAAPTWIVSERVYDQQAALEDR